MYRSPRPLFLGTTMVSPTICNTELIPILLCYASFSYLLSQVLLSTEMLCHYRTGAITGKSVHSQPEESRPHEMAALNLIRA